MTELEKAARIALEALESMKTYAESTEPGLVVGVPAITALRRALEQPAQHIEHCLWARNGNTPCPHVQPAKPKRPQNCGTGYCSCIECVMESEVLPPEMNKPGERYIAYEFGEEAMEQIKVQITSEHFVRV